MKTTLKRLLDRLDAISREHEEIGDTDVREQMYEAVYHSFIVQTPGYAIPAQFGMAQPAGDAAVRGALSEFIAAARDAGLTSPQERFAAFQDSSVLSAAGNPYDEHFGHAGSLEELTAAMSRAPVPSNAPPKGAWWQFWK